MNKQKLFSNITDGTIVRFFQFSPLSNKYGSWALGVVHRRQTYHFVVHPIAFPYVPEERFRYDGLFNGEKGAPQIVFFLTPEEEKNPLIQEYRNILIEECKLKQKRSNLCQKMRDTTNPLFKNIIPPEFSDLTNEQAAPLETDSEIPF
ncbi:hypothetical protein [Akkermansia muciniphila]|uniref:hypothetical protein n=1 Tax=Akkermansia muciniphila TaxID=239935 RepID=UPI00201CB831|nr:hypothetical protein [Akkermansia muciniphila]MCL6685780.1 hypothetical protein [Akkermansia muciniphila]